MATSGCCAGRPPQPDRLPGLPHRRAPRRPDVETTSGTGAEAADAPATGDRTLALLLSAAMFVLVVDTSFMNVSISAVVEDLNTTASGVQGTIALEALTSAALILIGGKVADLIGRKRAYL